MVLVVSPGYLKSPWCQREKNAFYDLLRSKNRSSNSVFVVQRDRVEHESCPEEIRDLLGFCFWEERGKGKEPRIAGEPVPLPDDLLYWGELSELAGKLSHALEQLRGSAPIEPTSGLVLPRDPTEAPAKRPKVFLAEVTDDLYKARKKLLGALEQAGAEVFPKAPYSLTAVEYEQALGRDLGGCSLFVQLLSDLPGRELHGSTKTIVTAQIELARSLNKTILQWRDRNLDLNEVEEDAQRQILEGSSVMAISLEELQYEVLQKAFPKPARESYVPLPTSDALVFVHFDAIDQALVKEICEILDREQIGWVVPSETGSPDLVSGTPDLRESHSSFGQAQVQGGVAIDPRPLSSIHEISSNSATVGAGLLWSQLFDAAEPLGLTPPVLTDYLHLSVGGTLSVSGIGGSTSLFGAQVDNVLSLRVVTGKGKKVACSPTQSRDLFHAVLAGVGQCGIIVCAKVRLHPAKTMALVFNLFYDDLNRYLEDQLTLLAEQRFSYLEGHIVRNATDTDWRFMIEAAKYFKSPVVDRWTTPHPWVNLFIPASETAGFISDLVADLIPADLGVLAPGVIAPALLYPFSTGSTQQELLPVPDEAVAFHLSLLRFPPADPAHRLKALEACG